MGRAAREKRLRREQREAASQAEGPPRWAGANGFDYAWTLNEGYLGAVDMITYAGMDPVRRAEAGLAVTRGELDLLERKLGTLEAAAQARGIESPTEQRVRTEPMLPGGTYGTEHSLEVNLKYAAGLGSLARSHKMALERSTPLLFDPLGTPEADDNAIDGLRLPFPVVTCDFLAQSGVSMPVMSLYDDDQWVGLIAATIAEVDEGVFDVWPVVTTLSASRHDKDQPRQRALLYGRARLGGKLPGEPPEGLDGVDLGDFAADAWVMPLGDVDGVDHTDAWSGLWVLKPALAAVSALRLLDAVNVSLQEAQLDRPERRRAERAGRKPALEVAIRSSGTSSERAAASSSSIDWQHRWTVRGHWMHFKRGPIFNANPRKRIIDPAHGECVRVWCPPFVKGPDDKPLVLKTRRVLETAS